MGKKSKQATHLHKDRSRGAQFNSESNRGGQITHRLFLLGVVMILGAGIALLALVYSSPTNSRRSDGGRQENPLAPQTSPASTSRAVRHIISPNPMDIIVDLVRSHPDPWIRTELDALVLKGHVLWSTQEASQSGGRDAFAYFFLSPERGNNPNNPGWYWQRDKPVIQIPKSTLMNPSITKEKLWISVFHEGYHLRHYLDGKSTAEIWRGYTTLEEFQTVMTKKNLALWFEYEVEAHINDCEFSRKNGWNANSLGLDYCQAYQNREVKGLRRVLASGYSRQPIFAGREAELAGLAER